MLKLPPWGTYLPGQKGNNESRILCSYLHEALSSLSPQAMLLAPFQLHPPVLEPSLHLDGEGRAEKISAKGWEERMLIRFTSRKKPGKSDQVA